MSDPQPAEVGPQPNETENPLQADREVVADEDEQYPPAHPTDVEPPEPPDDEADEP